MHSVAKYEAALYLVQLGLNDCQIARAMGLSNSTVGNWRRGERGRGVTDTDCPVCGAGKLEPTRYAYLLGLYLGDGCLVACHRDVYRLEIALDSRYHGIVSSCVEAVRSLRADAGSVSIRDRGGHVLVTNYWKHWPCVFPQHGPGPKHLRRIALAPWQREIVDKCPADLLRGLIHSDGWRGINQVVRRVGGRRKRYAYPRYQFSNRSRDITTIFCRACDVYGVRWKQMNRWNISIARAPDVAKLDEVVGPKG